MAFRIIPRLDIKAPNLVKGVRLEGLRKLGKPEYFSEKYYQEGADEVYYQDIVASLYNRNGIANLVTQTARTLFVPLTVGGGLRSIEDIQMMLRAGADKVCINTVAVRNPSIITEGAQRFGSQCIVVGVETIRQTDGTHKAFTDNGREHTGLDAYDWAMKAVELGAGELLISSVDREGTGKGFDLEFLERITSQVDVPVVAHGGAGSVKDIILAAGLGVSGVALARVLHYEILKISEIKQALNEAGIEVRTSTESRV